MQTQYAAYRSAYFRMLVNDRRPVELSSFRSLWRRAGQMATERVRQATTKLYWQNPNGTWSHHRDAKREWRDIEGCRTDLRFHNEWSSPSYREATERLRQANNRYDHKTSQWSGGTPAGWEIYQGIERGIIISPGDSLSYREAMIDAGRGHLLR